MNLLKRATPTAAAPFTPAHWSRLSQSRPFASTMSSSSSSSSQQQQQQREEQQASDWSATQYLKFGSERTRAVRDLVVNIPLQSPQRIIDLGCGPGNSTAVLAARWPAAHIAGVDSSPDMLAKARGNMPGVEFGQADLHTWSPPLTTTTTSINNGNENAEDSNSSPRGPDLLFSNAVFHWLRRKDRIPTILRLLSTQPSGGVFALQVPDNYDEPSHKAMRETAQLANQPWSTYFEALASSAAAADGSQKPELDPIETPAEWYDALIPVCDKVDVWHVVYEHVMDGPSAIVEWVRSTGLMPFLNALPEDREDGDKGEVRKAFLRAYEERLGEVYPRLRDGKVLLRYPRLFVVATKK